MPAFLVPVDAGHCLIPLEKAIVLIGRQADCDVSLTNSRKISRKHCCVAQVNNTFIVRDLGSTNGVFLNGQRIQKEAMLTMGDDLVIGDVRFRMQNEALLQGPGKISGAPQIANRSTGEATGLAQGKKEPASAALKTAFEPPSSVRIPPPIPIRTRQVNAPESMDLPVAIPEVGLDFDVEATQHSRQPHPRKMRVDDVVPLSEAEQEDEVLRLAPDSF